MVHLAVAIALGIIIACIAIPVGAVALSSIVELFRSEPKPLSPEVKGNNILAAPCTFVYH